MAKLFGLLRSTLADPDLATVVDAARDLRADETPALRVEGPAALRPFLAAGLAAERTVLVVTATDREADDLAAAVTDLMGQETSRCCPAGRPCRTSGSRRGPTRSVAGSRSSAGSPATPRRGYWWRRRGA